MDHILDLKEYRTPGAKVFIGRDRGVAVREASRIDMLAKEKERITIRVPENVYSVGVSFLEEFLCNVVTSLREEGFKDKIKFDNPGPYKIENDVNEAVRLILRDTPHFLP